MPSLQQALDTFLLIERRPQTNIQYRFILAAMARAIGPERDITLIRYEDLLDYQARLRQTRKLSTVGNYTAMMKVFFTWCVHRDYIAVSPALDLARTKPRRDPMRSRAVPSDELRRMVDYARVTDARNYALMLFLCDTGCRAGGLVSLTLQRLELVDGSALLEEKGGLYLRVIFGSETIEALTAWLKKRPVVNHDYVWTGRAPAYSPLGTHAVGSIIRALSIRTDASRRWSPHAIRHAVGHAWAKAGIPPHVTQQKLGHAHVSTTLNHYYPMYDPYVEVASRQLALATLRDDEDLREGNIVELPTHRRRIAR